MKLRFFTLNGRQPAPGTIVNLRLHLDGKVPSAGGALERFETIDKKSEDSPAFEFITEISKIDGNLLIATTRTDHMGYGRINFESLSESHRNIVLMLLVFGLASRQARLVLEIEGSAASTIDIFDVRGLYPLLYTRPEFKTALSAQNAAAIGAALLDFISGTDEALYLKADASSARGPVGHVDNPDQKDYEMSPESFVSRSPIKTGEGDGCEHLTPATLPLRQYSMYHVVVYDVAVAKDGVQTNIPSVNGTPPLDRRVLWGQILEFEQEWKSLGHSLGEVKYSLALAPGEAIKIAVIDWQRNDAGSRLGANASADKLTHDQTVDRDIDDIVKGRVTEQQSGSAFMAGLAGAMDFQIPQYGISAAGRHSIGYGTSNTEGKRDVSADAHQNVHLETLQRSNLIRSQNSSVIVQATQAESNYLSTRIVANMNRGHSLSILYYEVLRHFAVTTKFLRADTAILVPVDMFSFDTHLAGRFRSQLEPVLLDAKYGAGFDALERLAIGASAYATPEVVAPAPGSGEPPRTTNEQIVTTSLRCTVKMGPNETPSAGRGPDTPGRVSINIAMKDGSTRGLIQKNDGAANLFLNLRNPDGTLRANVNAGFTTYVEEATVRLDPEQISTLTVRFTPSSYAVEDVNSGWDVESILVEGKVSEEWVTLFNWNDLPKFSIPGRIGLPARNLTFPRRSDILDGTVMTRENVRSINDLMSFPVQLPASDGEITPTHAEKVSAQYGTNGLERKTSNTLWSPPTKSTVPNSGVIPGEEGNGRTTIPETKVIPTREADEVAAGLLVNHLNANQYYYNSYVWLLMDPRERRQRISSYVGNLLAGMSDTPLAMSGNHLAFRYTGKTLPSAASAALPDMIAKRMPKESIITLPTRGIFAEAHMGRCNAAEKRDITRLWNFDELPVSLLPNIETLTAGPRGAYQGLAPDAIGPSPLGIQGTPDLPAPGEAIAKALELLAKPEIFRDQSTREQVAEIMGKLIESAQPPKLTGENIGSAWGSGKAANNDGSSAGKAATRSSASPKTGSSARTMRRTPTERFDDKTVDKAVLDQARDSGVPADQVADLATTSSTRLLASNETDILPAEAFGGSFPTALDPYPKAFPGKTVAEIENEKLTRLFDYLSDAEFSSGDEINYYFALNFNSLTNTKSYLTYIRRHHARLGFQNISSWDPANGVGHNFFNFRYNAAAEANFVSFWDAIPTIFAKDRVNMLEFLTLDLITHMEGYGNYLSVAEGDAEGMNLSYFFEPFPAIPKAAYNTLASNRTCFALFADAEFNDAFESLIPANPTWTKTDAAWKGKDYAATHAPADLNAPDAGYIGQADFYKFRGRGFIQVTNRANYRQFLDDLRANPELVPDAQQAIIDSWDADANVALTRSTNSEWRELMTGPDQTLAYLSVRWYGERRGDCFTMPFELASLRGAGPNTVTAAGAAVNRPVYGPRLVPAVKKILLRMYDDIATRG